MLKQPRTSSVTFSHRHVLVDVVARGTMDAKAATCKAALSVWKYGWASNHTTDVYSLKWVLACFHSCTSSSTCFLHLWRLENIIAMWWQRKKKLLMSCSNNAAHGFLRSSAHVAATVIAGIECANVLLRHDLLGTKTGSYSKRYIENYLGCSDTC